MPVEAAAAPYANFNEKILAECYAPNAELGNFARMSFNIGPTLASWMRRYHPEVIDAIVQSDASVVATHGWGSAIAQSYHHTILPLASARDRRTEIRWGVRSFELLFGRRPLGIWLPETAVNSDTLVDCAAEGLLFTILAPGQLNRDGGDNGSYLLRLPTGQSFEVIIYNGRLGGAISFDPSVTRYAGEFTRDYVLPEFEHWARADRSPLVTIATDGEVYGHHHEFKDLFLRELLERALPSHGIHAVTAEQYVLNYPATRPAALVEMSSWGCPHSLARWSAGCDCTEGPSDWKKPLRDAFDSTAVLIDNMYEAIGQDYLRDPWMARDAYVDVVDGACQFDDWFRDWDSGAADGPACARVLLEAQRHRLAMYASCAFYWEDVSRIEPGYGIRRGLAAATLLDTQFGTSIAAGFVDALSHARSAVENRTAANLHAGGWRPHPSS